MTIQQEDITTIFVVGFPDDMKEREFQNMFIFADEFEGAVLKIPSSYTVPSIVSGSSMPSESSPTTPQKDSSNQSSQDASHGPNEQPTASAMNRRHSTCGALNSLTPPSPSPKKQIIGFARFRTQEAAKRVIETLNGRKVDPERCPLIMKAEFAKKNLLPKRGSICVSDYVHNIANVFAPPSIPEFEGSSVSNTSTSHSSTGSPEYCSLASISHLPPPPLPPIMLNTMNQLTQSPQMFQHRHSIHNYTSPYLYDHVNQNRIPIPATLSSPYYHSSRMAQPFVPQHTASNTQKSHQSINSNNNFINQNSINNGPTSDRVIINSSENNEDLPFGTSAPSFIPSIHQDIQIDNTISTMAQPQLHRSHSLVDMKLMNHSFLDVEDCYQQHNSLSGSTESEDLLKVAREMFPFLDEDDESQDRSPSTRRENYTKESLILSPIREYGDELKEKNDSDSVLFQPGLIPMFGGSSVQTSPNVSGSSLSLTIRPPRHNDDGLGDIRPVLQRQSGTSESSRHLAKSLGSGEYRFLSDTPPPHLTATNTYSVEHVIEKAQGHQEEYKIVRSTHEEHGYYDASSSNLLDAQYTAGSFRSTVRPSNNVDGEKNDADDIRDESGDLNHQAHAPVVTSSNGITTIVNGTNGVPRIFRNGPNGVLYPIGENPPCNTLYVGNLPMNANEDELRDLFQSCGGYKRLSFKMKPNGPMCFVEFDDVQCATNAMNELYGTMLSSSTKGGIRLSYSKNPLGVRPPGSLPKSLVNMIANHMIANGGINCHPGMLQHTNTIPYGGIQMNHVMVQGSGMSHTNGMYYPQYSQQSGAAHMYPNTHMHSHGTIHDSSQQIMPHYYNHHADENTPVNFRMGYHEKEHDEGILHDSVSMMDVAAPIIGGSEL